MLEAIIFVVFPFCMFFAAVSDVLSMKINNVVPLLLVAAFLLVAPMTGMPLGAIGLHLLVGVVVLCLTFALFAFGGMGGGDAKLIAASVVWMGLSPSLITYLIAITLIGGQLTFAILMFRWSPWHGLAYHSRFLRNFAADVKGVPYGIALGAGGMIAFVESPLVMWALHKLAS